MRVTEATTPEAIALSRYRYWANQGWPVGPAWWPDTDGAQDAQGYACACPEGFACSSRAKHPLLPNGSKDASTDPAKLAEWARRWPKANIFGTLGERLVLDVDPHSESGTADWPKWQTRRHLSGRGDGGGHLVFKLSAEQRVLGLKQGNKVFDGLDVKTGVGAYVILPPSRHAATGDRYREDNSWPVVQLPDEVAQRVIAERGTRSEQGTRGAGREGSVRSLLVNLLRKPPAEGGRNDWLTAVAGHYAAEYRRKPDLYEQHVNDAAARLSKRLSDAEVKKVRESVWRTELGAHPERDLDDLFADAEQTGGLVSGEGKILCQVWRTEPGEEEQQKVVEDWSNFDLRVSNRMRDDEGNLQYVVQVMVEEAELRRVIESSVFGDARKLAVWLASLGGLVLDPDKPVVRKPASWAGKLQSYVQRQEAPTFRLTDTLGWDARSQLFLTHDGALSPDGAQPWSGTMPNPRLKSNSDAVYHYGEAGTAEQARDLLRRVLTFHDEQTVAVAGAWWASTLLKHLAVRYTSQFPVLAVEAGSGSGKTTGFFPQLVKLSGSCSGASDLTGAVLRNCLSTNPSGIVWLDDKDNPAEVHEIMRQLTAGGTKSKMAEDRITTLHFHLVNSLMFSGESLGFKGEKALLDRAVVLKPPSPTGRLSQLPGRNGREQWLDVTELDREAAALGPGGLAEVAGHLVVAALREAAGYEAELQRLRTKVKGRAGDREVVLMAGAWLLGKLTGATGYPETVTEWLAENVIETFDGDNTLTRTYLPNTLRELDSPGEAHQEGPSYDQSPNPVFVKNQVVWFSPDLLATYLRKTWQGKTARDLTLENVESLREQGRKTGSVVRDQFRTGKSRTGQKVRYWALTELISKEVIRRASGLEAGDSDDVPILPV